MEELSFRSRHVPPFGSWDCGGNDLLFTQCFEQAWQVELLCRRRSFHGSIASKGPKPEAKPVCWFAQDVEMHRGKPLFLNQERYAALTHMVGSHGLDRSSKVLRQTTLGSHFTF